MKRVVSVLTIAIICTTVSYKSFAQKYFAGTVKFEIKYEGEIDPQKHVTKEYECDIFENKSKKNGNGQQIIYDGDASTVTVLLDLTGVGYDRVGKIDTLQRDSTDGKFTYEPRGDTKTICGYECKGYNVTYTYIDEEYDEEEEIEVKFILYTTTEIGKDNRINVFEYPGLSGYPLYTEIEKDDVKTIIQAKEIKKGKVKAIDFMIPSNYRIHVTNEAWEEEGKKFNEFMEGKKE